MTDELPKAFDPTDIEPRWYAHSLQHGVFTASDAPEDRRPRYVLPMPLPNVTGSLHMGHALMCTLEDVLARAHRMMGCNTLYYPGTDHAGIATQVVVERQLKREGVTRHDLGRGGFIDRVWQWKEECGGRIVEQQKALGLSADWTRSKFTMEADMSYAVREAFVRLYREGLIYRDKRLIYWDCEAQTVLSNLEVNSEEENGQLFEFAYPIAGEDGGGEIVVATTRSETMLGDTAVAVHPDDPRYQHLHGKAVVHPFSARRIPIITDAILVDMAFGTGAVKVTPAHDPNDFETGRRHDLELINILDERGRINENGAPFEGLDRFEARRAVERALDEKGLARGRRQHRMTIPRSDRTGSVVEPLLSTQWFVKAGPLAEPALEAVRQGRTIIIPSEWTKTYEHWMSNILDWCISRQLWWGHRIPAWYCDGCGHLTVRNAEELDCCEQCGSSEVRQEEDVLDTWFSSALWPLSTQGWPGETLRLGRFYPASDLETGYDILFFWVARMMMMGIHFMGEPPFKRILLHSLVVDETGQKMSKVKGNVIDPLDLVYGADFKTVVSKALPGAPFEEAFRKFKRAYPSVAKMGQGFPAFGTDALRFTLASFSPQSKRIPLSPKKIEGSRHFCNKIWNAVRFALPYLDGAELGAEPPRPRLLVNRWILARLGEACAAARRGIDEFRFDESTDALYHFFWGELCDWYLELSKPLLSPDGPSELEAGSDAVTAAEAAAETRQVLATALETVLRAFHPFMPFITEELWQRLPRPEPVPVSVALARLPDRDSGIADPDAVQAMERLQAVITATRTIRSERDVPRRTRVKLELRSDDEAVVELLRQQRWAIEALAGTDGPIAVGPRRGERPKGVALSVAGGVEVLVSLRGIVEAEKEQARVEREIRRTDRDLAALQKKLSARGFAERAPAQVVAEAEASLAEARQRLELLAEARELARELE